MLMMSCKKASYRPGARFLVSIPSGHSRLGCGVSRSTSAAIVPDATQYDARPFGSWFGGGDISTESVAPLADSTVTVDHALRRLETAIGKLSCKLKEPLVLTMLEGLSHKEAGALLGINAKAVETRVYRAKRQLASMLNLEDLEDISGTT